jgi:hypothetical protein
MLSILSEGTDCNVDRPVFEKRKFSNGSEVFVSISMLAPDGAGRSWNVENRGESKVPRISAPQISLSHLRATKSGSDHYKHRVNGKFASSPDGPETATTANAAPANPDMTGPHRYMNDWSWSPEEESAFSSTAFTLSGSEMVGARIPRAPSFALSVAARAVPIGPSGDLSMSFVTPVGRSQQKQCAPQEVDGSPLLTLLAAASLIDSFNYHDVRQGADSGGGSSVAGRAAAVGGSSIRAKLKKQLIQRQLIQKQGEGANQNAKASSRPAEPWRPAPAPSPAVPGRLTERQQLQRAIEESLGLPKAEEIDGGAEDDCNDDSGDYDSETESDDAAESDASDVVLPVVFPARPWSSTTVACSSRPSTCRHTSTSCISKRIQTHPSCLTLPK